MKVHKYPDGSAYVEYIPEPYNNYAIIRINSYEDLWHLTQYVDAANHNGIIPNIIIPCLLDGQADRRFESNQSPGLKLICKHLNSLKAKFKIFHPHNAEVVEALIDNVEIVDNYSFILNVLWDIKNNDLDRYPVVMKDEYDHTYIGSIPYDSRIKDNLVLLAPDAGAYKWITKVCDKLKWKGQLISASKSRTYEDGKTKLTQILNEQDLGGKDVLLIDDICIGGRSAIGLAKLLKSRNVGKLYAAFSHITIPNPDPELFELFDHVYTTNSKGLNYINTKSFGEALNLTVTTEF